MYFYGLIFKLMVLLIKERILAMFSCFKKSENIFTAQGLLIRTLSYVKLIAEARVYICHKNMKSMSIFFFLQFFESFRRKIYKIFFWCMSQTSRDQVNSRRIRAHEKNSGDAVRRLGTIIQSISCAQSGASIPLTVWKWSSESRYSGAFPPVLETFVAPFLPARLTAPGSPRISAKKKICIF